MFFETSVQMDAFKRAEKKRKEKEDKERLSKEVSEMLGVDKPETPWEKPERAYRGGVYLEREDITRIVEIKDRFYIVDKISEFTYDPFYSPSTAIIEIRIGTNWPKEIVFDTCNEREMDEFEKAVKRLFRAFGYRFEGEWRRGTL